MNEIIPSFLAEGDTTIVPTFVSDRMVNLHLPKYLFSSLCFLLSWNVALCQTNSDCNSAVSVCNAVYDEQDSPAGTGNVFEMAPGSCQTGGEFNSAWYVFSPQSDGLLSFLLEPNNDNDDYDWSLFDITENGCPGINSGASPEVSCNSYGETGGYQGPTGISTDEGGSGNLNGPGDLNGPPFNSDLAVTEGSIYALVVMNYSSTLNGYTLDFNTSGVSIFDETAPTLLSTEYNWCTGEVNLTFDENVVVTDLTAADFALDNPAYSVTSFIADDPSSSQNISLVISPLTVQDNLTVNISMTNGAVLADICGNEVLMPIEIQLQGEFLYIVSSTVGCNGTGATLDVEIDGNGFYPPYTVSVNGSVEGNLPLIDIAAGDYDVTITDAVGCALDTTVTVDTEVAAITLPSDTTLCSLSGSFDINWSGDDLSWDQVAGLTIVSPSDFETNISAEAPGLYTVTAIVTSGNCIAEEFMNVTFNFPPQVEIVTEDAHCYGECTGKLTVNNENPAPITVLFSGNQDTGENLEFTELCAGQYAMEIRHSPECIVDYTFTIGEPLPVNAEFTTDEWIVPLTDPELQLISLSENDDSLLWLLVAEDSLTWNDTIWDLSMPYIPGIYTIRLTASDTAGCYDVFEAFVEVRDEFRYYIPNSFTPNDDDLNDVFFISFTYPPQQYEFIIFNRDGDKVFYSEDYREVWMGEHRKGEYYCPDGVYNWQLTTRGVSLEEKTERGTVTLIR